MRAPIGLAVACLALSFGCSFAPPFGEGQVRCAVDDGPPCPPGYQCAADGRCYTRPPLSDGSTMDVPSGDVPADASGEDVERDREPGDDAGLDGPPPTCPRPEGCECLVDDDCSGDEPVCSAGRCVECRESSDCSSGEVCYPVQQRCRTPCTGPGACDDDDGERFCELETGRCLGCRDDADCGTMNPHCDPVRKRCVRCLENDHCGESAPVCVLNRCVQCFDDADCDARSRCVASVCQPTCDDDEDCTPPETCGGGAVPDVCGCTRTTCGAQGAECGDIADGCGGMLDCGDCDDGERCGVVKPNVCG